MCVRRPGLRFAVWLLVPIVVMTQFVYPYQYHRILARDGWGLAVLAGRNLLVLLAGILALAAILRQQGPSNPVARVMTRVREAAARWSGSQATRPRPPSTISPEVPTATGSGGRSRPIWPRGELDS